jgi:hypothetical protein
MVISDLPSPHCSTSCHDCRLDPALTHWLSYLYFPTAGLVFSTAHSPAFLSTLVTAPRELAMASATRHRSRRPAVNTPSLSSDDGTLADTPLTVTPVDVVATTAIQFEQNDDGSQLGEFTASTCSSHSS